MRVLADFVLDGDLCLPDSSARLQLAGPDGSWQLELSDIGAPAVEPSAQLAGRLTFEHAGDLQSARDAARDKLALALNALVVTTNRKFASAGLMKIIDWTPGVVDREAQIFHSSALDDRSEPALAPEFARTATRIAAMVSSDEHSSVMRWYRLGIAEENLEQQFTYFWFALEIAAQILKPTDKRYSECPKCHGKLYCEACQEHPVHRPYPGEAIKSLVQRIRPDGGHEIFEALQKVRHTLMHGRRIQSIAAELPCTDEQAVEQLARITWDAIALLLRDRDVPGEPLHFGAPESVVRRSLVAGIHVRTQLLRDHDNPRIENFPDIKITMQFAPRRTGGGELGKGGGANDAGR